MVWGINQSRGVKIQQAKTRTSKVNKSFHYQNIIQYNNIAHLNQNVIYTIHSKLNLSHYYMQNECTNLFIHMYQIPQVVLNNLIKQPSSETIIRVSAWK